MPRERHYPSDLSDAQWALVEPLLPAPSQGGRPEKHPRRDIVDAIMYVVRTGCAWRQLPVDFPPWQTVYWYFVRWEQQELTHTIMARLRRQVREQQAREPDPSAGLLDSQSVKGADTVQSVTRGFDAGKKIDGRKRFIVTDTLGLLLVVMVCAASVQDRHGAKGTLLRMYQAVPVRHVFADQGFTGALVGWAQWLLSTTLEIVRKPAGQRGFTVIPRRWVVERTFAWLTAHRRLARDYERVPATAEAMIRWAAINGMLCQLSRGRPAVRQPHRTFDWTHRKDNTSQTRS